MISTVCLTKNLQNRGNSVLALCAVLILGAQTASADTYSFSFETKDVLSALTISDPYFMRDGYFAFFLQPMGALMPINTYTYGYAHAAKEVGPDRWYATAAVDPSSPNFLGPGKWAQFSKLPVQTSVTLVSGANGAPLGQNIFMFDGPHSYAGSGPLPFGFGSTSATITSIMDPDGDFTFQLGASYQLPNEVTFQGYASAIRSTDDGSGGDCWTGTNSPGFGGCGGKTWVNIPFNLTLGYTQTVPEPGSVGLVGLASIFLIRHAARRRARKLPSASNDRTQAT